MSTAAQTSLATGSLGLTPGGVVICPAPENPLHETFAKSEPAALIALGGHLADPAADASTLFWKSLADHLIRALCQVPDSSDLLAAPSRRTPHNSPPGRSTPRPCPARNTSRPIFC